ncbi:MAG: PQQ-binding-like beta-propeller repeat protein [Planctomycetaceae bacterium]|nr:PQQ-binding-like beta-propeller repeat protein [Planctomycetaceae bacterium]MCB9951111.1 PQQ-binding-like beta-propeller repeat protein [Planctomycetaceae bacterium]
MSRLLLLFVLLVATSGIATAGDWPQILGPQRNGIATEEKLAKKWPVGGPPVVWERSVGHGYAGVAVEGERAVLFHRVKDEEVTECLNANTGETLWKQAHATDFYPQVGGADGPLCVPVISQGHVVTFGAQGVLSCFKLDSGEELWTRKTHEDYGALEGYFGAGATPIVVGELVLVNVGGSKEEAGVVAFDLATGETKWTRTAEPASYSAPVEVTLEGIPHVLMITRYKCILFEAESGAARFEIPFGQRGPTVNAATPLVIDNKQLFLTASYGIGSVLADFDILHYSPVWEDDAPLATQYCTPIHQNGLLYCIDGREDQPPADLKCIELKTGKLKWVEHNFGYGTVLFADEKLIIQKNDGDVILAHVDETGYRQLSHAKLLSGEVRALPALSNGRLFIRDAKTLKCVDIGLK